MNILLWIMQITLALHTAMGAVWKFSHSEETVASLASLPHEVWQALSGIELLCVLGLILPLFMRSKEFLAAFAALVIAGEMVLFSVVHLNSGVTDNSPMYYWLVVAGVSALLAYGRFTGRPS